MMGPRRRWTKREPYCWRPERRPDDPTLSITTARSFPTTPRDTTLTEAEFLEFERVRDDWARRVINDPYIDARPPAKDSVEWLLLAAHWEYDTRLVDVTLDPLMALYFASSSNCDEPG